MSRATLVTHNVWVGQPLDDLRDNVSRLAKATGEPLAIFLQESKRAGKNWTIPGYDGYTGPQAGDGDNSRILVRKDAKYIDSGWVRVPGDGWNYNGNPKPMRVFPWVAVRWRGRVWVLICVHRVPAGPRPPRQVNRQAWNAEHRSLVKLRSTLDKRWPNAVIVFAGDWNASMDEMPNYRYSLRSLRKALGVRVKGVAVLHIDGFMTHGAKILSAKKLDQKFGSDSHRPVVVRAEAL